MEFLTFIHIATNIEGHQTRFQFFEQNFTFWHSVRCKWQQSKRLRFFCHSLWPKHDVMSLMSRWATIRPSPCALPRNTLDRNIFWSRMWIRRAILQFQKKNNYIASLCRKKIENEKKWRKNILASMGFDPTTPWGNHFLGGLMLNHHGYILEEESHYLLPKMGGGAGPRGVSPPNGPDGCAWKLHIWNQHEKLKKRARA